MKISPIFFTLLIFAACSQDPLPEKFAPPVLTLGQVTADSTKAVMVCTVKGEGSFPECGFNIYPTDTKADTTKSIGTLNNDMFISEITDLHPETEYTYYAYISNGKSVIISSSSTFKTIAADEDPEEGGGGENPPKALTEKEALTALYSATGGSQWKYSTNWLSDEDISKWYGVTVEDGHVTKLEFNYNNMSGSISKDILSSLPYLWFLDIGSNPWEDGNAITEIDVSGNDSLRVLDCGKTLLTALDVSSNKHLSDLQIRAVTGLSSIDLTNNTELTNLLADLCGFTSLDVSHCPELINLNCDNNTELHAIDISSCTKLTSLSAGNIGMTSLDISHNPLLQYLSINDNQLTELDVSHLRDLTMLYFAQNHISSIDLTNCVNLEALDCRNNKLQQLDLSSNYRIRYLWCYTNCLTTLDIREMTYLGEYPYKDLVEVGNQYDTDGNELTLSLKMTETQYLEKWLPLWKTYTYNVRVREEPYSNILSEDGPANCYIASPNNIKYLFYAGWKGNSYEEIHPTDAILLWSSKSLYSSNTIIEDVALDPLTLRVSFTTKEEGNAVIAVRDAEQNILWSWHIWITDFHPDATSCTYSSPGNPIMMDRDLGALYNEIGDVRTIGLLYQWGRKDPFPGSASYSPDSYKLMKTQRGEWSVTDISEISTGDDNTLDYTITHPMCFISTYDYPHDWYTSKEENVNGNLWSHSKTMYDPCPPGWRVPDGNNDTGVWSNWMEFSPPDFDDYHRGMYFDSNWSYPTTWYLASGYLYHQMGILYSVGNSGNYWSCDCVEWSPIMSHYMQISSSGAIACSTPSVTNATAHSEGYSIRCQKDI